MDKPRYFELVGDVTQDVGTKTVSDYEPIRAVNRTVHVALRRKVDDGIVTVHG